MEQKSETKVKNRNILPLPLPPPIHKSHKLEEECTSSFIPEVSPLELESHIQGRCVPLRSLASLINVSVA